ncbi:hypothetical protein BC938DRAFT_473452 [Jimgerdemannia flammicorona]|uniref:DUF4396 domain-containing protein n=1 Tax=Jimgerdemannia flammicorona TaxID=994334 RepID=A0A433Q443_9FUNG|nr:hypothetical protein BC938DRAFT_473452 [Jimgerdemannia flammicorona]
MTAMRSILTRATATTSAATKPSCCHSNPPSQSPSAQSQPTHPCHTETTATMPPPPTLSLTSPAFWTDPTTWSRTRANTLRCLAGCTTGDFSMMWYLQLAHPSLPPLTCMAASMTAGIATSLALETVLLRKSLGIPLRQAFSTAIGMSFASMLAMEAAENAVDLYLTGGKVEFASAWFWASAGASVTAGYLVPLPFNYWRLRRLGKACH